MLDFSSLSKVDPNDSGGPLVSVIIPAYNEEKNIGSVLSRTHFMLKKIDLPHEIIVVNDGSNDKTAKIALENKVILIDHFKNRGKGHALKTGFVKAEGRFIVTMDADGSHRPEDLPSLLSLALNGNTGLAAVIGSRFNGTMDDKATSRLHILGNRLFNMLILLFTGKYVSDSQSGFRAYRRDALKKLILNSSSYDIDTEIIVKLLKQGFKVKEIPITCKRRQNGHSGVNSFRDGLKIFKTIIKARFL
jgi:glycosyltransferase involved in cell wall biosynthesis